MDMSVSNHGYLHLNNCDIYCWYWRVFGISEYHSTVTGRADLVWTVHNAPRQVSHRSSITRWQVNTQLLTPEQTVCWSINWSVQLTPPLLELQKLHCSSQSWLPRPTWIHTYYYIYAALNGKNKNRWTERTRRRNNHKMDHFGACMWNKGVYLSHSWLLISLQINF